MKLSQLIIELQLKAEECNGEDPEVIHVGSEWELDIDTIEVVKRRHGSHLLPVSEIQLS